jgi:hypothetical protein
LLERATIPVRADNELVAEIEAIRLARTHGYSYHWAPCHLPDDMGSPTVIQTSEVVYESDKSR